MSAQDRVDDLRAISAQRWSLAALSVGALVVACALIGVAGGGGVVPVTIACAAFGIAGCVRVDSFAGMVATGVVVADWLVAIDDPGSPLAMAVAACLLVFHGGCALMAVAPASATIDRTVVRRAARRSALVLPAIAGMWLLVVAMRARHAAGNALLTGAALVAIVAAVMLLRARSITRSD